MSALQPGLKNNAPYLPYWINAIVLGGMLNFALFLLMHSLGSEIRLTDPQAIIVDFMQWQEPARPASIPAPVKKPKSKTIKKIKPAISKPIKPVVTPKPVTKQIQQAIKTDPLPQKALTDTEPTPVPVEEPPAPEPVKEQFEESLPAPLPVFKATSLPRIAHLANLERFYPPAKRRQGIEAIVKLEVLIDSKGKPRKVTIIKSAGPAFDQAAIEAIMASSFIPARFDGRPGPVLWRFPVSFRLK